MKREEAESSKKPCLMKMTSPLLACRLLEEKMADHELVQSDGKAENLGIRKKEDELRINS